MSNETKMSVPVDVLAVPETFWNDHADRSPTNPGEQLAVPVGYKGRCVLIRADDPGIKVLLSDAIYYADADSMDECPRHVRDSARRTVAALARVGGGK